MYRRRRIKRDIPFSFDSFLDVVANVCGIIIRLILVAWVGARSYHAVAARDAVEAPKTSIESAALSPNMPVASADHLEAALRQHRTELTKQQERLMDQLRQLQVLQLNNSESKTKLSALTAAHASAERQRAAFEDEVGKQTGISQSVRSSLADLEKRSQQLAAELKELEKLPPLTKTLRYGTPVSRPVHTEELHFECKQGKISFIDVQAFLIEIRRGLEDKANELKRSWEVESTTSAIGPFRLRYVVERERGLLDGGGPPNPDSNFRYGLAAWIVEPLTPGRGAAADAALHAGSEFRRLTDAIDPDQTVVTLWVYPDSFDLYRQVRDFLHERRIEVAGRPLPEGAPIASSRLGSASRIQ